MNFKPGDIIENRWAGENNPTKYFMFLRWSNGGIIGLEYYRGFSKCVYDKSAVNDLYTDDEPAFRKVDHNDLRDQLKFWNKKTP